MALAVSSAAAAQNVENTSSYEWVMSQEVPVTDGDITDRPYRVVGQLTKKVRRLTIFSKHSSPQKVYRELWEKARNKYKADAVIFADFGQAGRIQREARGTAIRFLKGEELIAWRARNSD
ncbi:MAG: hypothetical protein WBM39_04550 [Parasphingorhabdus sp.]